MGSCISNGTVLDAGGPFTQTMPMVLTKMSKACTTMENQTNNSGFSNSASSAKTCNGDNDDNDDNDDNGGKR